MGASDEERSDSRGGYSISAHLAPRVRCLRSLNPARV